MKTLVMYVPVWHRGYERVLDEVWPDKVVLLNKDDFSDVFPELRKDIRALQASTVKRIAVALYPKLVFEVFDITSVIKWSSDDLVFTLDEMSRHVADTYFATSKATFHSAFLRWDKETILKPSVVVPDRITYPKSADSLFARLAETTKLSSDWWRQVASAIVKDGIVVSVAHNTHTPSEQEPYYQGDARSFFHKGEYIEVNTALHAEAAVIGDAAKKGVSLEGAELYATTFPCPYCARLIAHSGIKKLYYTEGYSILDGEAMLKNSEIEIIAISPK